MAQATAFSVNDGNSVAHTFTPVSITSGKAEYRNFGATYHIGQEVVNLSHNHTGAVRRVTLTLQVPRLVVETVNGLDVPSVPDYVTVKLEAFVPKTWGSLKVQELRTLFANIMHNDAFNNAFKQGEFVY